MRSFFLSAMLLSASAAMAAPLTVTEPPDMPDSGGTTYTVDVGSNSISGFVNGTPTGGDYQDNFLIFVPNNLLVTSAFVSITNFSNGGGLAGLGCFTGAGCFGAGLGSGLNSPAPGSTTSYTATSPWASDQAGGVLIGSFNWTLTLQVTQSTQPVPEPSTFLMIAPILAFAGFRLWSKL